jgi:dihydrofolate reductase
MITIIAASSKNGVIGKENTLPWRLPEDLKRFKSLTTGKNVLMGRKTYESIGKPLPNRTNIVVTRDTAFKADGVLVYNSLEQVLPIFRDIVVIGGGEIYNQFINKADVIELTLIDKEFEGDAFFPTIDKNWKEINRETQKNTEFEYHFITYINTKNSIKNAT